MLCPHEFNALNHSGLTNSTDKVPMSCIKTQLYTVHCLQSQHFFLMPLPVDHNIGHSSLLSSEGLFNKKEFCPLTNFILNFICYWLFVVVLVLLVLLLPFHNCMNI